MKNEVFLFGKMFELTNVGITVFRGEEMVHPSAIDEFYPIRDNEELRHLLMKKADESEIPAIYLDEHKVAFGACVYDSEYYFFGPVATEHLNRVELHRYYFSYGMRKGMEKPLPVLSYNRLLAFVELAVYNISGIAYENAALLERNQLNPEAEETLEKERFRSLSEEESDYHHTYMDEKSLLDCVREGRVEDALRMNARMDSETGKMSRNELDLWRKLVTVAIALSTRAAIEGGVSPKDAYSMSDYYTQKSDECRTVPELIKCRNQAVKELTLRVHEKQMGKTVSSYVERCCDYIGKHYREKIYLDDLAEKLGISSSYLSRLFVKEKGQKLQDYIVEVRVERAANLLTFSDESLAKIGDYVNFPSQSYFGKMFKKYKHMTPKEYRELYKPKEF
ncbi:MAG: AraC family transcriptional regulator [Eubacteriales bacterium]|nr:AraC family transcriptional regulator [Eubacteriales bacterium]